MAAFKASLIGLRMTVCSRTLKIRVFMILYLSFCISNPLLTLKYILHFFSTTAGGGAIFGRGFGYILGHWEGKDSSKGFCFISILENLCFSVLNFVFVLRFLFSLGFL